AAPRAELLGRVHELRRVDDDEAEPLAALDEHAQLRERVPRDRAHAGEAVRLRIGGRLLERVPRALDQHRLARAGGEGRERETARIGERVEHAGAVRVAGDACRVVLLVEVSARLLPAADRETPHKRAAAVLDRLLGRFARERPPPGLEAFLAPSSAFGPLVDAARLEQPAERRDDLAAPAL